MIHGNHEWSNKTCSNWRCSFCPIPMPSPASYACDSKLNQPANFWHLAACLEPSDPQRWLQWGNWALFWGWLQSSTMVQPQAEKSHQWITLLQAMDCGIKKSNWYPSKVDEPLQILHVQRVQPSKNDMYICYIAILQDFDDFDRTLIINPSWYQNISSSTNPLFS